MADEEAENGALLQGADGAMYFVPEADLAQYRLSDDDAASAAEAMEDDDEVSGFAFNLKTPGQIDTGMSYVVGSARRIKLGDPDADGTNFKYQKYRAR